VRPLLLLPLLTAFCSSLQDGPGRLPPAFAYPQSTVVSYWHSMLEHRHLSALECFADASLAEVERMLPLPELVELRCRDFRIQDRGRGQVDVSYTVEYRVAMGEPLAWFETGDRLNLTHGGWKIDRPLMLVQAPR
jgi:hypothetical protein